MFVKWLIFLHVASSFAFFLAHGTSMAMAFKIRTETEVERIRAMLDLSMYTMGALMVSFLVMGLSGLALPFMLKLWGTGWVWLSIGLILFVFGYMSWFNDKSYKHLRRLVGLPYMIGGKSFAAEPAASQDVILKHIKGINVHLLAFVGVFIPLVVVWLMYFKPF